MKIPYLNAAALLVAGLALTHVTAYATTVYDLTLTATTTNGGAPEVSGTGVLTLSTPITANMTYTQGGGGLLGLTIDLSDGEDFTLSQDAGATVAFGSPITGTSNAHIDVNFFVNEGVNDSITFQGSANGLNEYSISVNGNVGTSFGNITFNDTPVAPAPEPASMLPVGGALIFLASKRVRNWLLSRVA
jgi:hypothetical protein